MSEDSFVEQVKREVEAWLKANPDFRLAKKTTA